MKDKSKIINSDKHEHIDIATKTKLRYDLISLIIAGIAVMLSQFPPINEWFESYEIQIRESSEVLWLAGHPLSPGGMAIRKDISLHNLGDKPGAVRNIRTLILRGDSIVHRAEAVGYWTMEMSGAGMQGTWINFSEFVLTQKEIWSNRVVFGSEVGVIWDEEYWEIIAQARDQYMRRMSYAPYRNNMNPYNDRLIARMVSYVEDRWEWLETGPYSLIEIILVGEGEDSEFIAAKYEFTISRQDIDRMKEFTRRNAEFGMWENPQHIVPIKLLNREKFDNAESLLLNTDI